MNNKINKELSNYLDKYGYTDTQKLKVQEKLVKWVEDCKPRLFEEYYKEEQYSLELAEKIVQLVNKRVNENLLYESEDMNTWPIANTASRNLTGGNKALGALILCLLAEMTGEQKFVSLAKKLSYNSSDSTNESLNDLQAELYIRQKCDGLPAAKQAYIIERLQGITDTKLIDKQFKLLVEENPKSETMYECVCPSCGHTVSSKKACDLVECPECKESKLKPINDGLGYSELKQINETSKSPFQTDLQNYQDTWNNN